jgi:hypothetical protein
VDERVVEVEKDVIDGGTTDTVVVEPTAARSASSGSEDHTINPTSATAATTAAEITSQLRPERSPSPGSGSRITSHILDVPHQKQRQHLRISFAIPSPATPINSYGRITGISATARYRHVGVQVAAVLRDDSGAHA